MKKKFDKWYYNNCVVCYLQLFPGRLTPQWFTSRRAGLFRRRRIISYRCTLSLSHSRRSSRRSATRQPMQTCVLPVDLFLARHLAFQWRGSQWRGSKCRGCRPRCCRSRFRSRRSATRQPIQTCVLPVDLFLARHLESQWRGCRPRCLFALSHL